MGQAADKKLLSMASALISVGALVACGEGSETVRYDETDKGLEMPQPKLAAREKCYGIAPAQFNDCATEKLNDCAGTAEEDYLPDKWKFVEMGACINQGGTLLPPEDPYISEK